MNFLTNLPLLFVAGMLCRNRPILLVLLVLGMTAMDILRSYAHLDKIWWGFVITGFLGSSVGAFSGAALTSLFRNSKNEASNKDNESES